jgi:hypothetical protein
MQELLREPVELSDDDLAQVAGGVFNNSTTVAGTFSGTFAGASGGTQIANTIQVTGGTNNGTNGFG